MSVTPRPTNGRVHSKLTTCGHAPSRSSRGNRGLCDGCRLLAAGAMRLRQAADDYELAGATTLATDLRAIARDGLARDASLVSARVARPPDAAQLASTAEPPLEPPTSAPREDPGDAISVFAPLLPEPGAVDWTRKRPFW